MSTLKIVLGQPAFSALVRGGEVTVKIADPYAGEPEDGMTPKRSGPTEVKMILQDIGFHVMRNSINLAEGGEQTYKGVTVSPEGNEIK